MKIAIPIVDIFGSIIIFREDTLSDEVEKAIGKLYYASDVDIEVYVIIKKKVRYHHYMFKTLQNLKKFVIDCVKYTKSHNDELCYFYTALFLRIFIKREGIFDVLNSSKKTYMDKLNNAFKYKLYKFKVKKHANSSKMHTYFRPGAGMTLLIAKDYIKKQKLTDIDPKVELDKSSFLYWTYLPQLSYVEY